ncbi:hypothetical protein MCHI_002974 [Candidatus Magnetoovum chiemensis]|nr:hypothetical protein MCHI_002974 [Candidatus Magnetoovum chiemensis]
MSDLNNYIATQNECVPRLPLCHTFKGRDLSSIIASEKIQTSDCPVFNEPLAYFFYGKPAYRVSSGKEATSDPVYMPVCFVLSPDAVDNPTRIAAFDTGAFSRGLFLNKINFKGTVADFLLKPSMDMPARLVSAFYKSNWHYFYGKPVSSISSRCVAIRCYHDLISDKSPSPYDDRCETVEIQIDKFLELNKERVLMVILPQELMDHENIKRTITRVWKAKLKTYTIYRANPIEFTSFIYDKVSEFLKRNTFF